MGRKQTAETRAKISASLKGHTAWNKGRRGEFKHSEETKKKISESLTGRKHTEASRVKLSISGKLRPKPSAATRRKMSESAANRDSPAPRSNIRYSLDYEGKVVTHQSENEMRYFRTRSLDPSVWIRAYDAKRDGLFPYWFQGSLKHYRPDFVELREGHPDKIFIECKPTADMKKLVELENAYYKGARVGDQTAAKLAAYPLVELVAPQGVVETPSRG